MRPRDIEPATRQSICHDIELARDMLHSQLQVGVQEDVDGGVEDVVVGGEGSQGIENRDGIGVVGEDR